ncbi:hypothetical protein KIW84_052419 [Lathyrus oleraceus]|uniref:Uncharacterized protein n=1 Tax=Pisum sativum TaxID=3888 RepID=A0A9D4WMM5_PEA|nr:hypothetical protein KIW84_052419 [Pisum sativum]
MIMVVINLIKDLWRGLHFVLSIQFWRMALLWTLSVLVSHFQLLKDSLFSHKIVYPRCSSSTFPNTPVCVITGATSGLGFSTACKISKEGFVVVIGNFLFFCIKEILDFFLVKLRYDYFYFLKFYLYPCRVSVLVLYRLG